MSKQVLEEAADQVLDDVLIEEETPILLEQLTRTAPTISRSLSAQGRESSETLPSGRTILGTIVDPSGLLDSWFAIQQMDPIACAG